jgi:hypothetical protein
MHIKITSSVNLRINVLEIVFMDKDSVFSLEAKGVFVVDGNAW